MTPSTSIGMRAIGSALLLGAVLATPAAAAQQDRRVDVLGAAAHEWKGTSRCRGAKIRALQDALIESFDFFTKNTQGSKLRFYAYEAYHDAEHYAQVPSSTTEKRGTVGDSFGWESSPRLNLPVSAQKYYVLLACWDDRNQAGYRGGPKVAPTDISFGEYVGGAYYDGGGSPPESFRPATATHDYLLRVHSKDQGPRGSYVPFHDSDPFLKDPTRGRPGVGSGDEQLLDPEAGPIEGAPGDDSLLLQGKELGGCSIPTEPEPEPKAAALGCGEL